MNTYRLESKRPFNVERVNNVVQEIINRELANYVYDPSKAIKTCTHLTSEIKSRVKQLDFDRYKIVSVVSIVEKKLQDVASIAKFLWDSERDRFATYNFENTNVHVVASVFGIYYD